MVYMILLYLSKLLFGPDGVNTISEPLTTLNEGPDEGWLKTHGHQGLSEVMSGMFFPQLAEALLGDRVPRTSTNGPVLYSSRTGEHR